MYHQILPQSGPHFKKHIAVDPKVFREQIELLLEKGWSFETVESYFKKSLEERKAHTAILTFDDLSSSFVEHALPIMTELKVSGTLFPIQNMTSQMKFHNLSSEGIHGLTNEDLRALHQKGFEIGSHGQSHQNFRKISLSQVKTEMKESKTWLEDVTGQKITTICYPIGGVDRDVVEAAVEAGYVNGLTTLKGSLQFEGDRMTLRRVDIKNHIQGEKLLFSVGPFYGFRRFLTRPFRAKYRVSQRHPDVTV